MKIRKKKEKKEIQEGELKEEKVFDALKSSCIYQVTSGGKGYLKNVLKR